MNMNNDNGYMGENLNYESLNARVKGGFYSTQRIAPDNFGAGDLLPNSSTPLTFDIPIGSKAVLLSSMKIYFKIAVRCLNGKNTFISRTQPIVNRYELRTKSGQIIAENSKVRSFNFTFPDRIRHRGKKDLFNNQVFATFKDDNASTATISDVFIYGNYSSGFNYEESKLAAGGGPWALDSYSIATLQKLDWDAILTGEDTINLNLTYNLGELFGGIFTHDKDILLPNDNLLLTLYIDSFTFMAKPYAAETNWNSYENLTTNPILKEARIIYNVQESNEININILNEIKQNGIILPYEYHTTQSITTGLLADSEAEQKYNLNKTFVASGGGILRRIYLTSGINPTNLNQKVLINFSLISLMYNIKFYFDNTLISEINAESLDHYRGGPNNILSDVSGQVFNYTCFVPIYFHSIDEQETALNSGVPLNPSSVYGFDIVKTTTKSIAAGGANSNFKSGTPAGNITYDAHIITVKYLYISKDGGATVLNSIKEK